MSASKVIMKILSICVSLSIMILIVFGLYKAGSAAFDFGYRVFTEEAVATKANGEDKLVQISKDMDEVSIGDLLEQKGLVNSSTLFFIQLKLSAYSDKIKPGNYTLSTSMTAREMMQVMSAECIDDTETEE